MSAPTPPAAAPHAPPSLPGRSLAPPPTRALERPAPSSSYLLVVALALALVVGLAWLLVRALLSDPR